MNLSRIKILIKQTCLSFCLIIPVQSQEFIVGWELWHPYQFHNTDNKLTGVDIEIFNLIAKNAKISISYVELPWQRHLLYLKSGKVDFAFGASYTKEREETSYFSMPYRKETVNLFVKKDTSQTMKLNRLSDLINSEYLIGIENGYYYGEEFKKLKETPEFLSRIHGVLDIEQNVKMLMKGHINGFFSDPITMQSFIKKYKLQGVFEQHPLPIFQNDIYIMLSKKTFINADLAKINKIILSLQQSGQLEEILKRWSANY